jgi:hypothetical protein
MYKEGLQENAASALPNILSGDITMSSSTIHMEPISVHTCTRRRFFGYVPMGSRDNDPSAFLKTKQGKLFSRYSGANIDAPFMHIRLDTGYGLILYYPQYQNFIRGGKSNPAESVENIVQTIKWYGSKDTTYRWFASCNITNICFAGKLAHTMSDNITKDARVNDAHEGFSGITIKAPYGDLSNCCSTNVWTVNRTYVCTGCKQPEHVIQMMGLVNELNSTYAT